MKLSGGGQDRDGAGAKAGSRQESLISGEAERVSEFHANLDPDFRRGILGLEGEADKPPVKK